MLADGSDGQVADHQALSDVHIGDDTTAAYGDAAKSDTDASVPVDDGDGATATAEVLARPASAWRMIVEGFQYMWRVRYVLALTFFKGSQNLVRCAAASVARKRGSSTQR